jgi:L-seryl-tRNA(Ser) seleniumtransferase
MKIPSVNKILSEDRLKDAINKFGRGVVVTAIRSALDELRKSKKVIGDIVDFVLEYIDAMLFQRYVINATGDPLSQSVINESIEPVIHPVSMIDFRDILDGLKSVSEHLFNSRQIIFLTNLTSALSIIRHVCFGDGKVGAIIATRDIFRVDGFDIDSAIRDSGFELIEVGCSNKVHLYDYKNAIDGASGCHVGVIITTSSPRLELTGFVKTTDIEEIDNLAKERDILHIHIMSDSLPVSPLTGLIQDEFILSHLLKKIDGFIITETSDLMSLPKSSLLIFNKGSMKVDINYRNYSDYTIEISQLVNILLSLYNYYNEDIVEKNLVLKCLNRDKEELQVVMDKVKKIFKPFDKKIEIIKDRTFLIGQERDRFYIPIRNKGLLVKLNELSVILGNEDGLNIFDVRCVFDKDIDFLKRRL